MHKSLREAGGSLVDLSKEELRDRLQEASEVRRVKHNNCVHMFVQ